MNTMQTNATLVALRALYNHACHHPRCERGPDGSHTCSCGVSAALELARLALGITLDSEDNKSQNNS